MPRTCKTMTRLGFACKIIGEPDINMRTCRLRNATLENLTEISDHNLICLEKMINYCAEHKIHMMRIGSGIIPFGSHKDVVFDWKNLFVARFKKLGKLIRETGLRVSFHPGQYTVLNSPRANVVEDAVRDLAWHADFLDCLGVDSSSKIILHVGGTYGDKEASAQRFISNFLLLPNNVKQRLVLENDENYSVEEVIAVCTEIGVPLVYDVFHHEILPSQKNPDDIVYWIKQTGKTWKRNDGRQKIHYSQQKVGGRRGAHADTIKVDRFIQFYKTVSHLNLDIMLEVKDKNISVLNCMKAIEDLA